jgi:hypothetical protein
VIKRYKLVEDDGCSLGVCVEECRRGPYFLVGETQEHIDKQDFKIAAQAREIERLRKAIRFQRM